jgi:hypothetical protein
MSDVVLVELFCPQPVNLLNEGDPVVLQPSEVLDERGPARMQFRQGDEGWRLRKACPNRSQLLLAHLLLFACLLCFHSTSSSIDLVGTS